MGLMHRRSARNREPAQTFKASKLTGACRDPRRPINAVATRTDRTVRPTGAFEKCKAVLFIREAPLQFGESQRVAAGLHWRVSFAPTATLRIRLAFATAKTWIASPTCWMAAMT